MKGKDTSSPEGRQANERGTMARPRHLSMDTVLVTPVSQAAEQLLVVVGGGGLVLCIHLNGTYVCRHAHGVGLGGE